MGYIKEPDNVDFIINSEPLTKQERMMISELIDNYKMSRVKIDKKKNINSYKKPKKHTTEKFLL
jgi:hypothetical protein